MAPSKSFVTLGMFIIDEFLFMDEDGQPTGRTLEPQGSRIGGGGTYAAIGARIWLPPPQIGMIVDKGTDFPNSIHERLLRYGNEMWMFRDQPHCGTTRAINSYRGELRGFEYKTPRIRLTPKDITGTELARPKILHFICSPGRASAIMSEVEEGWKPITIYEPIPDRCVPEELPALKKVLPLISILSPNAEEALSLLSTPLPSTKNSIENAADRFLGFGVGDEGSGWVVIRSGAMGVYLKSRDTQGTWVTAFWTAKDGDKIVDVTGAGNAFLGGLAAGLVLSGDLFQATLYATISSSFIIEQEGLPSLTRAPSGTELWNGDEPLKRLEILQQRNEK
ncbi:Ribokinase-like protein [Gymnopilus junonius]|uniref:Ribokinase-like protein n=1 Tax=Gymnopilus junonius TaxID=109634 RepID=A0A9P5TNL1_GYMJU|nr:Ribokinase-like protein [Gymnopilus junonius]